MTEYNGRLLYPRLPDPTARKLIAELRGLSLDSLVAQGSLSHPEAAPSATGGRPADVAKLEEVRTTIRELAVDFGYPGDLSQARQAEFDRICGTQLFRVMDIVTADAANKQGWAFLSLVLLPEIAPWRFGQATDERFLGGVRNVFQRLWWRAWALGPDLTELPEGCVPFGEDDYVQLMERPTIGGNRRIVQEIQRSVWRFDSQRSGVSRSILMRGLAKRVRAERSHISLDVLDDTQLSALIDELARETVEKAKP